MSDELFAEAQWLIGAITRNLAGSGNGTAGVAEVLSRIAAQDMHRGVFRTPDRRTLPACRLLPDAVGGAVAIASDVAAATAALCGELHWQQNPNYSDRAMGMPGYMDGYAYAEIIGPSGFFAGDDFLLGLLLLGPRRLYRDHYHAAPELYWLLTGPSRWKRGAGGWTEAAAGETRWHRPLVVHATETLDEPLLAVWAWTRDVGEPARLVGQ